MPYSYEILSDFSVLSPNKRREQLGDYQQKLNDAYDAGEREICLRGTARGLGETGGILIRNFLMAHPDIEEINLPSNFFSFGGRGGKPINSIGFDAFLTGLIGTRDMGKLRVLNLSSSIYTPEQLGMLTKEVLMNNPSLTTLNLSSSNLTDDHIRAMLPYLVNSKLEKIELRCNRITSAVTPALVDALLIACPNLRELDIHDNKISDANSSRVPNLALESLKRLVDGNHGVKVTGIDSWMLGTEYRDRQYRISREKYTGFGSEMPSPVLNKTEESRIVTPVVDVSTTREPITTQPLFDEHSTVPVQNQSSVVNSYHETSSHVEEKRGVPHAPNKSEEVIPLPYIDEYRAHYLQTHATDEEQIKIKQVEALLKQLDIDDVTIKNCYVRMSWLTLPEMLKIIQDQSNAFKEAKKGAENIKASKNALDRWGVGSMPQHVAEDIRRREKYIDDAILVIEQNKKLFVDTGTQSQSVGYMLFCLEKTVGAQEEFISNLPKKQPNMTDIETVSEPTEIIPDKDVPAEITRQKPESEPIEQKKPLNPDFIEGTDALGRVKHENVSEERAHEMFAPPKKFVARKPHQKKFVSESTEEQSAQVQQNTATDTSALQPAMQTYGIAVDERQIFPFKDDQQQYPENDVQPERPEQSSGREKPIQLDAAESVVMDDRQKTGDLGESNDQTEKNRDSIIVVPSVDEQAVHLSDQSSVGDSDHEISFHLDGDLGVVGARSSSKTGSEVTAYFRAEIHHCKNGGNNTQSNLTSDQLMAIDKLIGDLQKEIDSRIPYPNKDRKQEKIDALNELKIKAKEMSVADAVVFIDLNYPHARDGLISTRTTTLLDELKLSLGNEGRLEI